MGMTTINFDKLNDYSIFCVKKHWVLCDDFEKAKKVIWKEMSCYYHKDSDEPTTTYEIKAKTIRSSNIKETIRGNIRLVENCNKNYLKGYVYSKLNPFDSIEIFWSNPKDEWARPDEETVEARDIEKIIIVGQSCLNYFMAYKRLLSLKKDVEIKVEV